MATTTYDEFGIRTKQGIYWLLGALVIVGANAVALYGLRTGELVRTASAGVWLVMVAALTIRTLRQISALEHQHAGHPSDPMRLLFRLAVLQPVLGIVPLLIGLR
jgi:purine-cytosine permease-like protein